MHDYAGVDLLQAHDFCVSIVLRAGSYLRAQAAARSGLTDSTAAELTATVKMSSVDLVTEADMEVSLKREYDSQQSSGGPDCALGCSSSANG